MVTLPVVLNAWRCAGKSKNGGKTAQVHRWRLRMHGALGIGTARACKGERGKHRYYCFFHSNLMVVLDEYFKVFLHPANRLSMNRLFGYRLVLDSR